MFRAARLTEASAVLCERGLQGSTASSARSFADNDAFASPAPASAAPGSPALDPLCLATLACSSSAVRRPQSSDLEGNRRASKSCGSSETAESPHASLSPRMASTIQKSGARKNGLIQTVIGYSKQLRRSAPCGTHEGQRRGSWEHTGNFSCQAGCAFMVK